MSDIILVALKKHIIDHCVALHIEMSDRKVKMDQEAKARIMRKEYKSKDGMATDWSKRAQSAADKNYPQHMGGSGNQTDDSESAGWCTML